MDGSSLRQRLKQQCPSTTALTLPSYSYPYPYPYCYSLSLPPYPYRYSLPLTGNGTVAFTAWVVKSKLSYYFVTATNDTVPIVEPPEEDPYPYPHRTIVNCSAFSYSSADPAIST